MTLDPGVPPTPGQEAVAAVQAPAVEPADLVVAAVTGVDGVAAMHPGAFGEVATYLPGRRVVGVQIRREVTNIDIVVRWGAPVPATAERVREVVEPLVHTPVHVTVQDVTSPGGGG